MDFKVTNQKLISATTESAYAAIESELRNITCWSTPYLKIKAQEPHAPLYESQLIWLYIGLFKFPKMKMKIIKLEPFERISVEYIKGDFTGSGEFIFKENNGATNVIFSWDTKINSRRIKLLNMAFPIRSVHFYVVNLVLSNLERYLINER